MGKGLRFDIKIVGVRFNEYFVCSYFMWSSSVFRFHELAKDIKYNKGGILAATVSYLKMLKMDQVIHDHDDHDDKDDQDDHDAHDAHDEPDQEEPPGGGGQGSGAAEQEAAEQNSGG